MKLAALLHQKSWLQARRVCRWKHVFPGLMPWTHQITSIRILTVEVRSCFRFSRNMFNVDVSKLTVSPPNLLNLWVQLMQTDVKVNGTMRAHLCISYNFNTETVERKAKVLLNPNSMWEIIQTSHHLRKGKKKNCFAFSLSISQSDFVKPNNLFASMSLNTEPINNYYN